MNRRELISTVLAAGTASALASQAGAEDKDLLPVIDTNIDLFQWPFRRLPLDETDALVAKLHGLKVNKALAGSFEALLHRDVSGVNLRLAKACEKYPELEPVGAINLSLPDWEGDLQRCLDDLGMRSVRLLPNYHQYSLDAPECQRFLGKAAESDLLVQIAVAMEDTRTQHPLVQVPDVDLSPLAQFPEAKIQLLNWRPRRSQLEELAALPNLYLDTSRADGTDGVAQLLEVLPLKRVLFGSNAPFLIPEAALIRAYESELEESQVRALLSENANELLHLGAA